MITRRAVVLAMGAGLAAWPLAGAAQRAEKIHRVGALWAGSATRASIAAFKQGLRELGYIEGQSIVFEERFVAGDVGRYSEVTVEILRLKVDVLVTTSTRAAQAAMKVTRTVPIVITSSGDPVGAGLAASLARPGRNVTGLAILSPELSVKRLQLLKEAIPDLKRVAVLWNPDGPVPALAFKAIQAGSGRLAMALQSLEVRSAADFDRAAAALGQEGAQGMLVIQDPLVAANVARVVALAAERGIPAIYPSREFADAGGLISYGPSYLDMYRRAGSYVDRILKGAAPAELPIEQPTKFEFLVNARTAKNLRIAIPAAVLSRADAVIR